MITVAQTIEKLISSKPTYGEALAEQVVNFSAMARKLKPEVEEVLLEEVTEGAIVMALKRYAEHIGEKHKSLDRVLPIRNIIIRSNLTEIAFQNSPKLNKVYQELLKIAEKYDNPFMNYTQGMHETTFDISDVLVPHLRKMTPDEKVIAEFTNLSAISVRCPNDSVVVPGVYYPCVKALAWERINVYQIVSYFTEVVFVVSDNDIEKAFSLMKAIAKKAEVEVQ